MSWPSWLAALTRSASGSAPEDTAAPDAAGLAAEPAEALAGAADAGFAAADAGATLDAAGAAVPPQPARTKALARPSNPRQCAVSRLKHKFVPSQSHNGRLPIPGSPRVTARVSPLPPADNRTYRWRRLERGLLGSGHSLLTDCRLRDHRRLPHGGPGVARRLHRLVLPG